jgi:hypothetical protein
VTRDVANEPEADGQQYCRDNQSHPELATERLKDVTPRRLVDSGRFYERKFSEMNISRFQQLEALNYRIIVNTVQCDSISKYLLPLHVSVS